MDNTHSERLLDVQQTLTSLIALGASKQECLDRIALELEALIPAPDVFCVIWLLDKSVLRIGSSPSIAPRFCAAIEGADLDQEQRTCWAKALDGKELFCPDIVEDDSWVDYASIAKLHGIRSAWTMPITSSYGNVLGTLDMYFGHKVARESIELKLLLRFRNLASLVIERDLNSDKSKALNQALKHNNHRFESFAKAMPDLVLIFDEHGNYVDIYGSHPDALILPANLLIGRNLSEILPPAKSAAMLKVIKESILEQKRMVHEYHLDVQMGERVFEARVSPVPHYNQENPTLGHVIWVAQDITERKRADETIHKLSFYDAVTSLPNRKLMKERLGLQIRKASDRGLFGAILYLDLNDFKRVNETVGVSGGDAVIVEVAKRIADQLDLRDSLARVGGDDFVILLDKMTQDLDAFSNEVTIVATKVLSVFDERFKVAEHSFRITARFGISLFGWDYIAPEKLINQAESAMYRAKESLQRVVFFDSDIQIKQTERIHMEYDLERAIENKEIHAVYQPQVNDEGYVAGFEALMRWQHSEKGLISPLEFIPLAEQLGIIPELQEVVLMQVCDFVKSVEGSEHLAPDFRIAVNISAVQFSKDDLDAALIAIIQAQNVSLDRFTLEITESTLLENIDRATSQMERLQSVGLDISIDDFGTGYSSLAYLQQLPANELKIDKSFIDGLDDTDTGRSIVDVIIYLGRQLGCRLVAEGVETASQRQYLEEKAVDMMQGYYFSKPISSEQAIEWLRQQPKSKGNVFAHRA